MVALLVAQRRPDLAARLVLIGQSLNSAGRVAGGLPDAILGSDPERPELVSQLLLTFLRDGFPAGPAPQLSERGDARAGGRSGGGGR